jgi:hypothetical protein
MTNINIILTSNHWHKHIVYHVNIIINQESRCRKRIIKSRGRYSDTYIEHIDDRPATSLEIQKFEYLRRIQPF